MKIEEARSLNTDNLREELEKAYRELFNLRFQKATRQLADSTAIPKTRKDVARILTALRERELIEQAQGAE
ncbi:50S ribosomal protein L29 [Dehalococcoidia bacterium]|nr:50S ribosomal protein L29 [Dehalococcoidia bacterium]